MSELNIEENIIIQDNLILDWKESYFQSSITNCSFWKPSSTVFTKVYCTSENDRDYLIKNLKISFCSNDSKLKILFHNKFYSCIYFIVTLFDEDSNIIFDIPICSFSNLIDLSDITMIHASPDIQTSEKNIVDVTTMKTSLFSLPTNQEQGIKFNFKFDNKYYSSIFYDNNYYFTYTSNETKEIIATHDLYGKTDEQYNAYYVWDTKTDSGDVFIAPDPTYLFGPKNKSKYIAHDVIPDDFCIWTPNSETHCEDSNKKSYFVFESSDFGIYIGNPDGKPCVRLSISDERRINNFYVSNNNYLIVEGKLDPNMEKYLDFSETNIKYELNMGIYCFRSLTNVFPLVNRDMAYAVKSIKRVYFNSNDKPCCYIENKKLIDGKNKNEKIRMNVGYTKTWFLCALFY